MSYAMDDLLERACVSLGTSTCVALSLALAVSLASMLDVGVWWLELPAQFRWHAFLFFASVGLLTIAVAIAGAIARARSMPRERWPVPWRAMGLALADAALTGHSVATAGAPAYGLLAEVSGGGEVALRVIHFNLGSRADDDWRDVLAWLEAQPADVIFLQEARPGFARALDASPLAANVVLRNVRPDSRGTIALVRGDARLVDATLDVDTFATTGRELARVRVQVRDETRQLLSVHLCRPTNAVEFAKQSYEIEQLGRWFEANPGGIAIGDLNCAAYPPRLRRVLRERSLHATTVGTWPAALPSWTSVPIDVLVTDSAALIDGATAGPNLGSDHRPLIVTLRLAP